MKWYLNQLNQYRNKDLLIDETIEIDDIKQLNPEIRDISSVHVEGRGYLSGHKMTFHLSIRGSMILPCSRTLADVHFPFDIKATETFLVNSDDYSVDQSDEDLHRIDGEILDLIPYIKENILLEIPIQIFSDNPSEGQAPQSGNGWDLITDQKLKDQIDPRLADLKKFFDKK